ncbi:DMT family transporter [Pusillimonas sp. CC-YST705]|uniref:DMT family transporter n=1 Tax=Mesopusillimonas faecipullorum TaxID=2755040 RepID=A0ABS8CAW5_9BURK|nr:DMT family transporter [Mesopusillimonas faecipullorum]MCB5363171.1 DMT family transporter [Mesopusillimonas faecipullorum]
MFIAVALFVFIWSTGFTVGKIIVPYADPTLFLFVRVSIAAVLFIGVAWLTRAPRLPWREVPKHILAGILLQGLYLSGCYWAIGGGLPPSIMALIGSTQPILTAVLAIPLLGELPTRRVWAGLALGLTGVLLVIAPGLSGTLEQSYTWLALFYAVLAMVSLTLGTLLQKTSIAKADIRSSAVWQNLGTWLFTGSFTLMLGESKWIMSTELWASLLWAAIVMTGVGTSLLVWIIRRGGATKASALMFLSPPLVAIESYLLFGDVLLNVQLLGFVIAVAGVLICNMRTWPAWLTRKS